MRGVCDEAAGVSVDHGDEAVSASDETVGAEIALDRLHVDRGQWPGPDGVVGTLRVET